MRGANDSEGRNGRGRRSAGAAVLALARGSRLGTGAPDPAAPGAALFREVPPEESGITWVHDNALSPDRFLPETTGAGAAFLDYDGDGWMDVYLVNSGPCDFFRPRVPLANALYRNNRDGTFTDVTDKAGVAGGTFGMGAFAADYDNDGHTDLYVTAYGRATLYHNEGNGTFTDVTDTAGVAVPGWTTPAVFFDYDGDGRLDLFAGSYVRYGLEWPTSCSGTPHGKRYYCVPRIFEPLTSHLFRNEGGGRFADVSEAAGFARAPGKALGVVATRLRRRRAARPVRHERHVAELPLDEPGRRPLRGDRARGRGRLLRQRQAAVEHGHRHRRLRRRRPPGPRHRQHRPRAVRPLPQPGRRGVHRRGGGERPRRRDDGDQLLGRPLPRLRRRRAARPRPRERPPRRHARRRGPARCATGSRCCCSATRAGGTAT